MRTFHLAALLLLFLPLNLSASPDLGVYECGGIVPAVAFECSAFELDLDDPTFGTSATFGATHLYVLTDNSIGLDHVHSTRSSRWWLTDAYLRQLLAPVPI